MAIKYTKTRSSRKHNVVSIDYKKELTTGIPHKPLIKIIQKQSGRNFWGSITTLHKSGKYKRIYLVVDFKRNKDNLQAVVKTIEYDPNSTALFHYYVIKMIKGDTLLHKKN